MSEERQAVDSVVTADNRGVARRAAWIPALTLVVGLVVSIGLAVVSHQQHDKTESRLLTLRTSEVAAVLTAIVPSVQTPLASAAQLADATDGDPEKFKRSVESFVGLTKPFISVSLWRVSDLEAGPIVVAGEKPELSIKDAAARRYLRNAARDEKLSITALLKAPNLRLGYAATSPSLPSGYVAYGESVVPADRRVPRGGANTAFSDLDFALYLGEKATPATLLLANADLPLGGRTTTQVTEFGDRQVTLVVAPRISLSGKLPERLPWIIAIGGALLSFAAAAGAYVLTTRRRDAERLTDEVQRLYAEQRSIAQVLQHALLPDTLPRVTGVDSYAHYTAGERTAEIGGDWYDVIELDANRLLAVIGDVTGKGLRAATTMASLRYAIHAYAAQDDPPTTILTKLSDLLSVSDNGQLATVMLAIVDTGDREICFASAGHLPALLISDAGVDFLEAATGPPIGVRTNVQYESVTLPLPRAGTFLAFTDGLVERRGESIDAGLARLRDAAKGKNGDLKDVVDGLVHDLAHGRADDDIAIVGLRWNT